MGARTIPLAPTAIGRALVFLLLALVGDAAPLGLARAGGFLLRFAGLGPPLLARLSPPHASWLKLGLFGALLSPLLATAVYGGLRLSRRHGLLWSVRLQTANRVSAINSPGSSSPTS